MVAGLVPELVPGLVAVLVAVLVPGVEAGVDAVFVTEEGFSCAKTSGAVNNRVAVIASEGAKPSEKTEKNRANELAEKGAEGVAKEKAVRGNGARSGEAGKQEVRIWQF